MRKTILFSPGVGGHYPLHLKSLLRYWNQYGVGELFVILSPLFPERHRSSWEEINGYNLRNVKFYFFSNSEEKWLRVTNLVFRSFYQWIIISKYLKQLTASHCFINVMDHLLLPLSLGLKVASDVKLSGILFRPTMHYDKLFENQQLDFGDLIRKWQKKTILHRAMRNNSITTLFLLDPYAVDIIQGISQNVKVVHLPEPFLLPEVSNEILWEKLYVDAGRMTFLLFGALSERKGIFSILSAIELLQEKISSKVCVLFVGTLDAKDRDEFYYKLSRVRKISKIQVIYYDRFITDTQVFELFKKVDVVLVTYTRDYVGSSGILIWAAKALKPVIATKYGMVGKLVKERGFGVSVDPENPREIALEIEKSILNGGIEKDDKQMLSFSSENTDEAYANTIITSIFEIMDN